VTARGQETATEPNGEQMSDPKTSEQSVTPARFERYADAQRAVDQLAAGSAVTGGRRHFTAASSLEAGRAAVLAVVTAAVLALGACGDQDQPEAQPTPGGVGFEEGDFDELPVPPRADPLGPRQEEEGVLARSWSVRNTTAAEVLEFYEQNLMDGWQQTTPTRQLGDAYRGIWRSGDEELRVSATPAPAADQEERPEDQRLVQVSLQLSGSD
jgi:hypothetical protein